MSSKLVKLLELEGYNPEDIPAEIERRKNLDHGYQKFELFRQKHGGKSILNFIIDHEKRLTALEKKKRKIEKPRK